MSQNNETENTSQNEENSNKTPLELVKEQQAMQQQSHDAVENRPDHGVEIPGHSEPSDRRKHPQRQMYEGGTADSETI